MARAVSKLVSLPPESAVTLLGRIGCRSDKVVLLIDICTHDVTYGQNFTLREVMVFRPDPRGGVLFEKYIDVNWVQTLPWYAGVVGTFIDMKAKEDGRAAAVALARTLKNAASESGASGAVSSEA